MERRTRIQHLAFGWANVLLLGLADAFFIDNRGVQLCYILAVAGMSVQQQSDDRSARRIFVFPFRLLYDRRRYFLFASLAVLAVVPAVVRALTTYQRWDNEFLSELLQGTIPNLLVVSVMLTLAGFLRKISNNYRTLSNHLRGFQGGIVLSIIAQTLFPIAWIAGILNHQGTRSSEASEVVNTVFIGIMVYVGGTLVVTVYSFYLGNTKRLSESSGVEMPTLSIFIAIVYNTWWPLVPLITQSQRFAGDEAKFDLSGYVSLTAGIIAITLMLFAAAYRAHKCLLQPVAGPWSARLKNARSTGLARTFFVVAAELGSIAVSAYAVLELRMEDNRLYGPQYYTLALIAFAIVFAWVCIKITNLREQELRERLEGLGWSVMRTGRMSHDVWTDPSGHGRLAVPRGKDIDLRIRQQIDEEFGGGLSSPEAHEYRPTNYEVFVQPPSGETGHDWWIFNIPSLRSASPRGGEHRIVALGQAGSATQVEQEARDIIRMWVGDPRINWDSTLPDDVRAVVRRARHHETLAEEALRDAARDLVRSHGLALSDVSAMLGVPPERLEDLVYGDAPRGTT